MKKLMKYIKSPGGIFTIIGFLVGITGLILAFAFRTTNEITVRNEESTQIVINTGRGIRFLFGDVELESAFLTTIRITNTGTSEIVEDDFREPLRFVFYDNIQIYDVLVMENTTGLIGDVITSTENNLEIENFFLNPRDDIYIQVLSNYEIASFEILHRIVGLNSLRVKVSIEIPPWLRLVLTPLITSITLLIFLFIMTKRPRKQIELQSRLIELQNERIELQSRLIELQNEEIELRSERLNEE